MYSIVPLHLGLQTFGMGAYGVFQCIPELCLKKIGQVLVKL
jgi:hypothetical protein